MDSGDDSDDSDDVFFDALPAGPSQDILILDDDDDEDAMEESSGDVYDDMASIDVKQCFAINNAQRLPIPSVTFPTMEQLRNTLGMDDIQPQEEDSDDDEDESDEEADESADEASDLDANPILVLDLKRKNGQPSRKSKNGKVKKDVGEDGNESDEEDGDQHRPLLHCLVKEATAVFGELRSKEWQRSRRILRENYGRALRTWQERQESAIRRAQEDDPIVIEKATCPQRMMVVGTFQSPSTHTTTPGSNGNAVMSPSASSSSALPTPSSLLRQKNPHAAAASLIAFRQELPRYPQAAHITTRVTPTQIRTMTNWVHHVQSKQHHGNRPRAVLPALKQGSATQHLLRRSFDTCRDLMNSAHKSNVGSNNMPSFMSTMTAYQQQQQAEFPIYNLVVPYVKPLPTTWTWVKLSANVHAEDDPVLRYNPYFGDNSDATGLDVSDYAQVPGELEKEVQGESEECVLCYLYSRHAVLSDNAQASQSQALSFSLPSLQSGAQKNGVKTLAQQSWPLVILPRPARVRKEVFSALQRVLGINVNQLKKALERIKEGAWYHSWLKPQLSRLRDRESSASFSSPLIHSVDENSCDNANEEDVVVDAGNQVDAQTAAIAFVSLPEHARHRQHLLGHFHHSSNSHTDNNSSTIGTVANQQSNASNFTINVDHRDLLSFGIGTGLGILNAPHFAHVASNFRDFFCRRCFVYGCPEHSLEHPLPNPRSDPEPPFLTPLPLLRLFTDSVRAHRRPDYHPVHNNFGSQWIHGPGGGYTPGSKLIRGSSTPASATSFTTNHAHTNTSTHTPNAAQYPMVSVATFLQKQPKITLEEFLAVARHPLQAEKAIKNPVHSSNVASEESSSKAVAAGTSNKRKREEDEDVVVIDSSDEDGDDKNDKSVIAADDSVADGSKSSKATQMELLSSQSLNSRSISVSSNHSNGNQSIIRSNNKHFASQPVEPRGFVDSLYWDDGIVKSMSKSSDMEQIVKTHHDRRRRQRSKIPVTVSQALPWFTRPKSPPPITVVEPTISETHELIADSTLVATEDTIARDAIAVAVTVEATQSDVVMTSSMDIPEPSAPVSTAMTKKRKREMEPTTSTTATDNDAENLNRAVENTIMESNVSQLKKLKPIEAETREDSASIVPSDKLTIDTSNRDQDVPKDTKRTVFAADDVAHYYQTLRRSFSSSIAATSSSVNAERQSHGDRPVHIHPHHPTLLQHQLQSTPLFPYVTAFVQATCDDEILDGRVVDRNGNAIGSDATDNYRRLVHKVRVFQASFSPALLDGEIALAFKALMMYKAYPPALHYGGLVSAGIHYAGFSDQQSTLTAGTGAIFKAATSLGSEDPISSTSPMTQPHQKGCEDPLVSAARTQAHLPRLLQINTLVSFVQALVGTRTSEAWMRILRFRPLWTLWNDLDAVMVQTQKRHGSVGRVPGFPDLLDRSTVSSSTSADSSTAVGSASLTSVEASSKVSTVGKHDEVMFTEVGDDWLDASVSAICDCIPGVSALPREHQLPQHSGAIAKTKPAKATGPTSLHPTPPPLPLSTSSSTSFITTSATPPSQEGDPGRDGERIVREESSNNGHVHEVDPTVDSGMENGVGEEVAAVVMDSDETAANIILNASKAATLSHTSSTTSLPPAITSATSLRKRAKPLTNFSTPLGIKNNFQAYYQPCMHEGPCGRNSNCVCLESNTFCEKYCGCDPLTCRHRFPGCVCKKSECRTKTCPCYAAKRVCDPDLCGECGASVPPFLVSEVQTYVRAFLEQQAVAQQCYLQEQEQLQQGQQRQSFHGVTSGSGSAVTTGANGDANGGGPNVSHADVVAVDATTSSAAGLSPVWPHFPAMPYCPEIARALCCNRPFAHRRAKRLQIGPSTTHGWGAFATEKIEKGGFIAEYTGELISQTEGDRRGIMYDRFDSSYLFETNLYQCIDATRKGNKTRFINHHATNDNVVPQVIQIDGDHKVGMFAKHVIHKGDELFFNYGYQNIHQPEWARHHRGNTTAAKNGGNGHRQRSGKPHGTRTGGARNANRKPRQGGGRGGAGRGGNKK